jgi:hypothetical protein
MAQVRCSNCGGYKVKSEISDGGQVGIWIVIIIAFVLFAVHWIATVLFILIGAFFVAVISKQKHYCHICGLRWKS